MTLITRNLFSLQHTMERATTDSRQQSSSEDESARTCGCSGNIKFKLPKHFTKKCIALLHALCHVNIHQRGVLLRAADKNLVRCICECILNILKGNIVLPGKDKKKLSKHKKVLRKLVDKINTNRTAVPSQAGSTTGKRKSTLDGWKKKKRILLQSGGGFLPLLIAPLISTFLSKILNTTT